MQHQVESHFSQPPDAEIYPSQPGIGSILGARVLAEFDDADSRYTTARARKNYASTSPITRQSGKKKIVTARVVHNNRLVDVLDRQAESALTDSPAARRHDDRQRARGPQPPHRPIKQSDEPHSPEAAISGSRDDTVGA